MNKEHRLGPYQLIRRLGTGGMAETWLAVQQSAIGVRKFVALKCILPTCNDIPDYIRLFYHEAGIALRLQHPNLLSTWACHPIDGRHVMTMEYLHGITLQELLERLRMMRRPLRYDIAAWIAVQILSGLDYLHTLQDEFGQPLYIVHRDVTPHNIFLCFDGQCKLFDFGIAQTNHEDDEIQRGMIVGKPAYMSPEQCQCGHLSGKSDDFSMAVILYEMTTGIQLFERESEIQTFNALMNEPVIPPASRIRDFPSLLSRIIMHGLDKTPERRYESSAFFANDLRMYLNVNGKTNAQNDLKNLIAELFSEELRRMNGHLSEAVQALDKTAPTLSRIISESRPICDIPSGVAECISVSRIDQLNIPRISTTSAPHNPILPEALQPSQDEMLDIITEENDVIEHKNVAQRMKKWIFGNSQESHS